MSDTKTEQGPAKAPRAPMAQGGRYLIISGDSHVGPSVSSALRPYCESTNLDIFDEYSAELDQHKSLEDSVLTHLPPKEHMDLVAERGRVAGLSDPHARLRDMDADGIAADVIFHGGVNGEAVPFSNVGLATWGSQKYQVLEGVGCRIYNRWLADFVSVAPHRHAGVAQIPIWDVDGAVTEVKWAKEAGLRSINLPAQRQDFPSYDQAVWDPLWDACEDLDMPVSTHAGGGDVPKYSGEASTALFMCEMAWYARRATWFMILGGVFERHRDLTLVLTEQFGDWVPETLTDMDSAYLAPQQRYLRKTLPRRPSEYWMDNCFVGASFMSRREATLAVENGLTHKLMWGSDYPHQEGTWPRSRLSLRKTFADLDPTDIDQLVCRTAAKVYGFDVDVLAATAGELGPTVEEMGTPLEELPTGHLGFGFREVGKWA